jgi:hypothetical protein
VSISSFFDPWKPLILGKNNAGCMHGKEGRKSDRLKDKGTIRLKQTSKYHLEEKPTCKTTTCTLKHKI